MVVHYNICMMWYRINQSVVEYVAGSIHLWRNEGLLISHSVTTHCGVALHLWSMKPTQAWEQETIITHILLFLVICSNWYTRILDRYSPAYPSMRLKVIERIWYDISRTQLNLYIVWRLVQLGIQHKRCACMTLQSHLIGGLGVEQQHWCLPLSSCSRNVVRLRIHAPVKDHYWSNHPSRLSAHDDHCAGIQLARKLTHWLY